MKYRTLSVALIAAVPLLSIGLSSAIENKPDTETATKVVASPKVSRNEINARNKHAARIKLVDINNADKEELKKLPGISDAQADKIIASRPFGSKAWLATHNIIPAESYQAIKKLIVCKLSKQDIDKIMAQSAHEHKK